MWDIELESEEIGNSAISDWIFLALCAIEFILYLASTY